MPTVNLLLQQGRHPTSDASSTLDIVRGAIARGAKRIDYYKALPNGLKGLEPHLALCSFKSLNDTRSTTEALALQAITGQISIAPKGSQEAKRPISPSANTPGVKRPALPNDSPERAPTDADLPQANASEMDIITWTDDDIDSTDFKNMPDYDPDQDESVYESTPEPEVAAVRNSSQVDGEHPVTSYIPLYRSDPDASGGPLGKFPPYFFLP